MPGPTPPPIYLDKALKRHPPPLQPRCLPSVPLLSHQSEPYTGEVPGLEQRNRTRMDVIEELAQAARDMYVLAVSSGGLTDLRRDRFPPLPALQRRCVLQLSCRSCRELNLGPVFLDWRGRLDALRLPAHI